MERNNSKLSLVKLICSVLLLIGTFSLSAQVYTPSPYSTGFETGMDPSWTTTSSLTSGRIRPFLTGTLTWSMQTAYSHTGNYFLGMDDSVGGTYNLNEAKLHLDLSGTSNLRLGLWWAEWNDESEAQDGIYVSDDAGVSYVKVLDLPGTSYTDLTWTHFDMSLDSINAVHGLSFTSTYIVKFQQYDNFYFAGGNDGFLFDDIDVYSACNTSNSISTTVCASYTVPSGNATYTMSGMYSDTIMNAAGCDSIITIDLTVLTSSSSIIETVCESYTVPSGSATYTISGIYSDTVPNAAGCDSIISIDLTVNQSSSTSMTVVACDSYTAPDSSVYSTSGIYASVFTGANGCDSTILVDLTINVSTSSTITESAIDTYTAPSGAVYTTSGVYTDVIPNAAGCDSAITINLTVGYTGTIELDKSIILVYPNPIVDVVTFEGLELLNEVNALFILDNLGAIVMRLGNKSQSVDLSVLSAGVYFLEIHHSTGRERIKLLKQ
ncbi:MAG: hypothetical protein ACI8XB_002174 [Patiriisocius sp.]|jgi:hypothetical protein